MKNVHRRKARYHAELAKPGTFVYEHPGVSRLEVHLQHEHPGGSIQLVHGNQFDFHGVVAPHDASINSRIAAHKKVVFSLCHFECSALISSISLNSRRLALDGTRSV